MIATERLSVTFADGTEVTVTADQRDAHAFDLWAFRRGILAPEGRDLFRVMPTTFLRVCAWSALNRANDTQEEWDAFDARAAAVAPVGEAAPVDPTGEGSGE